MNGNGFLALIVGIAVILLTGGFAMMITYGMMASWGVVLGTMSFLEALGVSSTVLGISAIGYAVGGSILKSA
jgi:hypothetical protein